MGLLSIFKRNSDARRDAAAASTARESVQQARVRARRRLIGAVVLVAIGIIGFPLLFESTPRPIPVDIQIEIPSRDAAQPLAMPPPRPQQGTLTSTPDAPGPAAEAATGDPRSTPRAEAGVGGGDAQTPPPPTDKPVAAPAPVVEPSVQPKAPASTAAGPNDAARAAEAARARALLEGRAPPARDSAKYVVQVGAFADSSSAQEVRQKAEKLGLKTYTQVVATSAGNRIRVRLGPFASRDEAEKAFTKAKAAGINAVVLPL